MTIKFMKIHSWFYLISPIQVTKVVCKEQSPAVDDKPFDVMEKLYLKKFEKDWYEDLHLSVSKNKKAYNTESTDQLLITSHQHKGAQKVNDDVGVLVSESWPSLSMFHDMDEVGVSSFCPEIHPCTGIAQKDLEYLSALSLCSDNVADMYEEAGIFGRTISKLYTKNVNTDVTVHQELEDNKTGVAGGLEDLADGLAKTTSITTLSLTINSNDESYLSEDWAKHLGDGLAKNTSTTTLSLTINSSYRSNMSEHWAKDLGDGLAKNTSITTLSVTINSSDRSYLRKHWEKDLAYGLAKNKSITTVSVTINDNGESHLTERGAKLLGDGLAKNTSITTFNLTINSNGESYLSEDWAKDLGEGFAKNTSITTLSLTVNDNGKSYLTERGAKRLGDGLAKNTSITTFDLTINSNGESYLSEDWAKVLNAGLAKNTSMTTFSLTINSSDRSYWRTDQRKDWAKDLADGLAKNINNYSQPNNQRQWKIILVGTLGKTSG